MKSSTELHRQKILIYVWDLLTTKKNITPEFISEDLSIPIGLVRHIIVKDKLKNIIKRHNKHPNQLAYNPNA